MTYLVELLCRAERPVSHDSSGQRDASVCGLRNIGFKTRSCRSTLSVPGDSSADGFLGGAGADPAASTVTAAAGLLSPPAADARYARRQSSGGPDDAPAADASPHRNMAANSRRKADKPRKRKRASSEQLAASSGDAKTAAAGGDNDGQLAPNADATQDQVNDCTSAAGGGIEAVDSLMTRARTTGTGVGSPLPEDLSTVRAADNSESPEPLGSSPPSHDADVVSHHQAWLLQSNQTTSSGSGSAPAVGVIADYAASSGGVPAASSVHDLEAAMNKHLPTAGSADLVDPYGGGLVRPHRSAAIQWISTAAAGSSMSAHDAATSTLLRSMYPNQRESVIRTNVYNSADGGGGGLTPGSAQRRYYPATTADVQSALLTPPGATETAFISAATAPHSHAAKTPPSVGALSHAGGYGLAAYGGGGAGDAYAMTPPSSASPQDALAGTVTQYALEHPAAAVPDGFYPTAAQHHQHSQHLHHYHHHHHHSQLSAAIKPLHYGAAAAAAGVYEHSMSYHQAAAAAAMAAGYYSSNGGGSLASYGAHYRDAMKHANATW